MEEEEGEERALVVAWRIEKEKEDVCHAFIHSMRSCLSNGSFSLYEFLRTVFDLLLLLFSISCCCCCCCLFLLALSSFLFSRSVSCFVWFYPSPISFSLVTTCLLLYKSTPSFSTRTHNTHLSHTDTRNISRNLFYPCISRCLLLLPLFLFSPLLSLSYFLNCRCVNPFNKAFVFLSSSSLFFYHILSLSYFLNCRCVNPIHKAFVFLSLADAGGLLPPPPPPPTPPPPPKLLPPRGNPLLLFPPSQEEGKPAWLLPLASPNPPLL